MRLPVRQGGLKVRCILAILVLIIMPIVGMMGAMYLSAVYSQSTVPPFFVAVFASWLLYGATMQTDLLD